MHSLETSNTPARWRRQTRWRWRGFCTGELPATIWAERRRPGTWRTSSLGALLLLKHDVGRGLLGCGRQNQHPMLVACKEASKWKWYKHWCNFFFFNYYFLGCACVKSNVLILQSNIKHKSSIKKVSKGPVWPWSFKLSMASDDLSLMFFTTSSILASFLRKKGLIMRV